MNGNLKVTLAAFAFILSGAMALSGCNTVEGAAYGTGRAVDSTARGVSADVHAVTGGHHHRVHHHKMKTASKTKVKHTTETTTMKQTDQSAPTSTQSSY